MAKLKVMVMPPRLKSTLFPPQLKTELISFRGSDFHFAVTPTVPQLGFLRGWGQALGGRGFED